MNDFIRDDAWQKEQRDTILAPGFYSRFCTDGRYVFVDKGRFSKIMQRRFAVDTVAQGTDGNAVAIEEKIVRWPGYTYKAYTLETHSCTVPGRESPGWMEYGQPDYLLYCFQRATGNLDCHLIDFQKLKDWFWPRVKSFDTFGPLDTLNRSMGRIVPIPDVGRDVGVWQTLVHAPAKVPA